MSIVLRATVVALLVVCGAASASAQLPTEDQPRPPRRGGAPKNPSVPQGPLTNEEVYRALDSFVMTQAQVVLDMPMGDPTFAEFSRRLTHLQMVQRRHRNQRQRVLAELRRLSAPAVDAPDDAAITGRVKELDELEAQFQAEERQALAAIDLVLEPRQRGRFRVFLENIELRKIDLLMRARQGRGQGPAGRAPIR